EAVASAATDAPPPPRPSPSPRRRSARARPRTDFLSPSFVPQKRRRIRADDVGRGGGGGCFDGTLPTVHERRWDERFALLASRARSNGDCEVPPSFRTEGGVALGRWLENQRAAGKRGELRRDRIERLRGLGVSFGEDEESRASRDDDEDPPPSRAAAAAARPSPKTKRSGARRKVGNSPCKRLQFEGESKGAAAAADDDDDDDIIAVPLLSSPKRAAARDTDAALSPVVKERQEARRKSSATDGNDDDDRDAIVMPLLRSPKRAAAAEAEAALSPVVEERWEARLRELVYYRRRRGDCNVPSTYEDVPGLAKWVENQRMAHRKRKLSDRRAGRLRAIGFDFGASKEDRWEFHFRELLRYRRERGSCLVPQRYRENPALGRWVNKQREMRKAKALRADRFEKLREAGFWER
ncbi:hypothetical protein ACHAWF_008699, partial [Thalassiosira exigua]